MTDLTKVMNLQQLPEGVVLVSTLPQDFVDLGALVMEMWSTAVQNNKDQDSKNFSLALSEFNEAARRNFTCGKATAIERNGLTEYQPYDLYQKLYNFMIEAYRVHAIKQLRMAQFTLEDLMGDMMKRKLKLELSFDGFTHEWSAAIISTLEPSWGQAIYDIAPSKNLEAVLKHLMVQMGPADGEDAQEGTEEVETPPIDTSDIVEEAAPAPAPQGVSAMVAAAMKLTQQ